MPQWSLAFSACQRSRKATLLAMRLSTVRDFKAIDLSFGDEPPRMIWPVSRCHIQKGHVYLPNHFQTPFLGATLLLMLVILWKSWEACQFDVFSSGKRWWNITTQAEIHPTSMPAGCQIYCSHWSWINRCFGKFPNPILFLHLSSGENKSPYSISPEMLVG